MYRSLCSIIPNADDLLALDLEQLGRVLLVHLKSYDGVHGNTVYQNGLISQYNFVATLEEIKPGQKAEYGDKQSDVNKALLEAWNWLERAGILIKDPGQPLPWFSISRKGQELLTQAARIEHFERLGLARVKADLETTGGTRDVGGPLEARDLAWKWVEMKEAKGKSRDEPLTFIADSRLEEIRKLVPNQFDFRKIIRLCEELNIVYGAKCYFATAMLTRGLLDHVPPLFGKATFSEVANNYSGAGRSFNETMRRLDAAARKIADAHLHAQIRRGETLPVAQQVNFSAELDVLLSEIVRMAL